MVDGWQNSTAIVALWSKRRRSWTSMAIVPISLWQALLHPQCRLGILASRVARLTIIPWHTDMDWWDDELNHYNGRGRQSILKIVPLLTNLQTISSPAHTAHRFRFAVHLTSAIIQYNCNPNVKLRKRYLPISLPFCWFWHCTTLCFMHLGGQFIIGKRWPSQITFPNLINLRLHVVLYDAMNWIVSSWKIPALKRLSISGDTDTRWVWLLQPLQHSLEALQVHSQILQSSNRNTFTMTKLKELYVINSHPPKFFHQWSLSGPDQWYTLIKAPIISRIVHSTSCISEIERFYEGRNKRSRFFHDIWMIDRAYPVVKAITIICPNEQFLHSYCEDNQDFDKHIALWCGQDRSVEVITGAEGYKKIQAGFTRW